MAADSPDARALEAMARGEATIEGFLGRLDPLDEVLICEVGTCAKPAQREHSPCCSSTFHGKSFCCEHYCRTHFVEHNPCTPETHTVRDARAAS